MARSNRFWTLVSMTLALLPACGATQAQTLWQGETGSWFDPANWTEGVPEPSVNAVIDNGGTAQLWLPGGETKIMTVGETSSALPSYLNISDGGTLTSSNGYVGHQSGSQGVVTVTGAGSVWSMVASSSFRLGYYGSGMLTIADGGQVYAHSSLMNSSSMAIVTGSGSTWSSSYELRASGNVTIEDGGLVSSKSSFLQSASVVTGSGSRWTNSEHFYVGYNDSASLLIENGGEVSTTWGVLADGTNKHGVMTVTGAGSQFTSRNSLTVGRFGIGTLSVSDGALVSTGAGRIGDSSFSQGTALVTGIGSLWTSSSITVGRRGAGSLTIEKGGQVDSGENTSRIGEGSIGGGGGGTGTVTVTGAGSAWTTAHLTVGLYGTGTMIVENEGLVTSTSGIIGNHITGRGFVTVTGSGSQWIIDSSLSIGHIGGSQGTLTIEDGGLVASAEGIIKNQSAAIVTGSGSLWAIANTLDLNTYGSDTETLTVADGGRVTANTLYAFPHSLLGDGTIVVKGIVIEGDLLFDGAIGPEGVAAFGSGGRLLVDADGSSMLGVGRYTTGSITIAGGSAAASTYGTLGQYSGSQGEATVTGSGSTWTNAGELFVGRNGAGTLIVEGGGHVSSESGFIGDAATSQGAATVTGTGSQWAIATDLYVGRLGPGTLTIEDQGLVSTHGLKIAGSNVAGRAGTLTIGSGGQLSASFSHMAYTFGSQAEAVVSGSGSSWTNGAELAVGYSGVASLIVEDGARVSSATSVLGQVTLGAIGTATVTGAGSLWTASGEFTVGQRGFGVLDIVNGGQVSSHTGIIASGPMSQGDVAVSGPGSAWIVSDSLTVGGESAATLGVLAGGQVSSHTGVIAYSGASQGAVAISGPGSAWVNSHGLTVGRESTATLEVLDGGQVSSRFGMVGQLAGSQGTASVAGPGSAWSNLIYLSVGEYGNGALTIGDGGQASAFDAYIGRYAGSQGALVVDGPGSVFDAGGSVHVGGRPSAAGGSGTFAVQDGGEARVGLTLKLWANGEVILDDGGTLSARSIDASAGGQFRFDGGTLRLGGYKGHLVNSGGTVVPGFAESVATIEGSYTQSADGRLVITIGDPQGGASFVALGVTGPASLDGALEVAWGGPAYFMAGQTFDIVHASSFAGEFASVTLPTLPFADDVFHMQYRTNSIRLTALVENPVPGDFNGDGILSGLDIPAFKQALADPEAWAAGNSNRAHPDLIGDFNGDGAFSGLDIPGFKAALATASASAIPEPATALLLGLALATGLARRRNTTR